MEDFCTQKSSYFYHKILSKTQKLCTFLTSADFKAFLYVNPLINFNNPKTNQQICILATFFVLQPFWYILCCVLQSPLFKGFKLAQTTERRPNLVNLPVFCEKDCQYNFVKAILGLRIILDGGTHEGKTILWKTIASKSLCQHFWDLE